MLLFNEVEIVLEALGVAAAGNFLAKKLLFAKDREQTVEQIRCVVLCGSAFYHYYSQLQELELHQVVNSKAAGFAAQTTKCLPELCLCPILRSVRCVLSLFLLCRDIVDNKIAAGEVGKDLRRVADTLVETVTETEQVVDKNVSHRALCHAVCVMALCSACL